MEGGVGDGVVGGDSETGDLVAVVNVASRAAVLHVVLSGCAPHRVGLR
jgi:hypothetical protein